MITKFPNQKKITTIKIRSTKEYILQTRRKDLCQMLRSIFFTSMLIDYVADNKKVEMLLKNFFHHLSIINFMDFPDFLDLTQISEMKGWRKNIKKTFLS